MKRYLSALLLACLIISQGSTGTASAMSGGMYDDAIEYVRDKGIAEGYLDGSFRAEQNINRAEFSKIIMLAVEDDGDDMNGSFCFRDVRNEWFAPYVCTARDHGMVSGYQDGTFRPEQSISFAEASSLIAKAYHGDMSSGGEWYTPYISQLDEWDAIPPTVYAVHEPLARGEMAYIIMMADHAKNGTDPEEEPEEEKKEDADIEISVHAMQTDAAPGESVTFIIEVENDGDDDAEFDIEATLDGDLIFRDAPDHDERDGDTIIWEDISLDEGDEESFTLTADVREGAAAGKALRLEVEADDEEDSVTITVRQTSSHTPFPSPVGGDPVLHWNEIALQANADDHTFIYGNPENGGPGSSTRALAIIHAAIYDAVNSIEYTHEPYIARIPVQAHERPSLDTAIAAAAYRTLTALYPNQRSVFDVSYQAHLARIPESADKNAGIRIGEAAAQQILADRVNDGSVSDYVHTASNDPGKHRPDPLNPEQNFLGAKWGVVKPFAIAASWQFRASPPPAITSKEYADAFNEVKTLGGDGITTPTTRTQDQTEIGLFWAYDGVKKIGTPNRLFNQIARIIARQEGNTPVENAHLFALINLGMADAGIAAWESKYHYDVWRPVIGIREADQETGPTGLGDNNPLTAGDATWTPLGAPMSNMTAASFTPPFPSYPSGHATFGGAFFRTLENYYGTTNISFSLTSDELNGVTTDSTGAVRPRSPRSYNSLTDAAKELNESRIYLGVHWRFDQDAGDKMGRSIADYMHRHTLRPVR